MPDRGAREFSVIVFGAGGYTGRRVAAYLAERQAEDTSLTWAPAGRDPARVAAALAADGIPTPAAEPIRADVSDPASLAEMAARADVILNLVGPYTRLGEPVIKACVEAGTDYVDLTGEIPFARRMLDRYGEGAAAAGMRVVQVCGFEALPADLAVLIAHESAQERWGQELAKVEAVTALRPPPGRMRASDSVTGGTAQSMAAVMADPDARAVTDPAALIQDPARAAEVRDASPIGLLPRRENGAVIAPMQPAAFINPAVIQRTAALAGRAAFSYQEGVAIHGGTASLPARLAVAGTLAGVQAGFGMLSRAGAGVRAPIARGLGKLLPDSGYGPQPDRLNDWSWTVRVRATSTGGESLSVLVEADGHPGYLTTARMLGEAGLLLGEAGATPDRTGFLTPATALGTDSAARLERAGIRFRVE